MGSDQKRVDGYLLEAILSYAVSRIDMGNSVMLPNLVAKLSQYSQDEIVDVLELLVENDIIRNLPHMGFGPGKEYLKWRSEISATAPSPSPTINIGTVTGPAHFGQGNINITNNDAEAIVKLVRELSKTTTDKTLGDKITNVLSGASGATTIIQGLIQLGTAFL